VRDFRAKLPAARAHRGVSLRQIADQDPRNDNSLIIWRQQLRQPFL
jgi:hypothetical protein